MSCCTCQPVKAWTFDDDGAAVQTILVPPWVKADCPVHGPPTYEVIRDILDNLSEIHEAVKEAER